MGDFRFEALSSDDDGTARHGRSDEILMLPPRPPRKTVQQSPSFPAWSITGKHLQSTEKLPVTDLFPESKSTATASAISSPSDSMDQRLLKAATSGDSDTLESFSDEELARKAAGGNTAAHLAVKFGKHEFLAGAVRRCKRLLIERNCNGDTPLHCAARLGNILCVRALLEAVHPNELGNGAQGETMEGGPGPSSTDSRITLGNVLKMTNTRGNTALHEAVRRGHAGVVQELLAIDASLVSVRNSTGESALYLAADLASVDIVEILVKHPHACCDGPGGKTALHAAVSRGHIDSKGSIATMLLNFNASLSRRPDDIGSTPLHYVASIGDLHMIKLLLEKDASAAISCDKSGFSPLHVAAVFGHVNVIQAILHCRPDAAELFDEKGRTFLHLAVERQMKAAVRHVLSLRMSEELLNMQDHQGNTALHVAVIAGNRDILRMLLTDKRVDRNIINAKGKTPLDRAASIVETSMELRKYKLITDLERAGTNYSPRRFDLNTNTGRVQEDDVERSRSVVQNLTITFVLIATVSFAAAFTLPGGYNQNDSSSAAGTALLTTRAAFKIFLISDALAMASSVTMILLLFLTGSRDYDIRLYSIRTSLKVLWVAIGGMVVAFAMGIYVAVAPGCLWLAVTVIIISCGVPVSIGLFVWRPLGYRVAFMEAINAVKRAYHRCCQLRKKYGCFRWKRTISVGNWPNSTELPDISPLAAQVPPSLLRSNTPKLRTPAASPAAPARIYDI